MDDWIKRTPAHFEAEITIYPLGEETRKTHPYNGIRWGFAYADSEGGVAWDQSNVFPEFVDESGNTLPEGVPLIGTRRALMHIISPDTVEVHLARLRVGTEFFCMEGRRRVASGVVTALAATARKAHHQLATEVRPTIQEIEAAARILDNEGRFYKWWPQDSPRYEDIDPIGKNELEAIVERMLMAAARVRAAQAISPK